MLKLLRIGTSAIALSALVAVPAVMLAGSGPVAAQQSQGGGNNGNGNGNGNAGGSGNGTNGNGNAFGHGGNTSGGGFSHGDNANGDHSNGAGNNSNSKTHSAPATGGNIKDAGGGNNSGDANAGFSGPDTETGNALNATEATGNVTSQSGDRTASAPRTTAFARVLESLFGAAASAAAPVPSESLAQTGGGTSADRSTSRNRNAELAQTRSTTVQTSIKPARRPTVAGGLHPANLGPVTGIINASTKAKLDRIATGNFSGPAGLAAALAIADYAMQALQEDLDIAKETLALAAAYDLIRNAPAKTETEIARDLLDNGVDDKILDDRARSTLSYPDLGPARLVIAEARANGADRPGSAALTRAAVVVNRLVAARAAITRAEENILSAYAGALDAAPETADRVIEAVRLANPTRDEIRETLPAPDSLTADNESEPLSPAESRLIESITGVFDKS